MLNNWRVIDVLKILCELQGKDKQQKVFCDEIRRTLVCFEVMNWTFRKNGCRFSRTTWFSVEP